MSEETSDGKGFTWVMMIVMLGAGLVIGSSSSFSTEYNMVSGFCDKQDQEYNGAIGYGPGETLYLQCKNENGSVESYRLRTWNEWKDRKVMFDTGYTNKTLNYKRIVIPRE